MITNGKPLGIDSAKLAFGRNETRQTWSPLLIPLERPPKHVGRLRVCLPKPSLPSDSDAHDHLASPTDGPLEVP